LSVDFVFVGAPLYVGPRGFFMRLWPPFVYSANIDSLLQVVSRGFFTLLFVFVSAALLLFANYVYVSSPLFFDFSG
jgi:hypothetical protein